MSWRTINTRKPSVRIALTSGDRWMWFRIRV
jgi:hypothetical protein